MTAITQNLPWFIKDLGISIVGKRCYVSLVENLTISDTECIKHAVSKGLGLGIVVGGSVMKVPQILIISKSRSAEGLSLTAYILETLSYAVTLAYSIQSDFPFTTYGENLFLTAQNALILLLITHLSSSSSSKTILTLLAVIVSTILLANTPPQTLNYLMYTTLPLSLLSKLPQIAQNRKARSTGNLSVVAVLAQVLGCVARLFTTMQETGDALVGAGFLGALVLNLVLGAQVVAYWPGKTVVEEKKQVIAVTEREEEKEKVPVVAAPVPSLARRVGTPPPSMAARTQSPAGARKWARKVD